MLADKLRQLAQHVTSLERDIEYALYNLPMLASHCQFALTGDFYGDEAGCVQQANALYEAQPMQLCAGWTTAIEEAFLAVGSFEPVRRHFHVDD